MKVVIAEKPSVAKDIAKVLGATEKKDGYTEGAGWQVTWAFGHLAGLVNAEAYDEKFAKWNIDDLPILPEEFKYELKGDPSAKKQYKTIKDLFYAADEIVVATDAGREGEAIFRYIYNLTGCRKPFKRLWISSLTESAIREGFANLKPGTDYDNLYRSAKCRNEADWLVGINATRSLTLSTHSKKPLSIGRVQTPTLALIAARYIENTNFQPKPYYVPAITLEYNKTLFPAKITENPQSETAEEIQKLIDKIPAAVKTLKKEQKEVTERPPLPYDLTSLQADANRRYKFKAQKTLDLMQGLYEKHKLLTYPRTASRYLANDMIEPIQSKLRNLENLPYTNIKDALTILDSAINKHCFDDTKLTDHHAIIPTFENIDKLPELTADERKIFDMVATQLLMSLLPCCIKKRTTYTFSDNLYSTGSTIVKHGWRMMEQQATKDDDADEEAEATLPDIPEGANCNVTEKKALEKMTKKPPLLSEATLLKMMESAGQLIDDNDLKKAIKDCGIGTPATRAAIIETLYKREYIKEEKNKLYPTELGLELYNLVKEMPISSPKMTGDWEYKLNKMADGEYESKTFITDIYDYTKQIVKEMNELGAKFSRPAAEAFGICPACGKPLYSGEKSVYCSDWKNGCQFKIWKTVAQKKLTDTHIKQLLEKGKTTEIKGFTSSKGTNFDAMLKLTDKTTGKVEFEFAQKKNTKAGGKTDKKKFG